MSSFDRIFHNLLRHGDSAEEMKRASNACGWLADHLTTIRQISDSTEAELLGYVYAFWSKHKKSPSIEILKEILERKSTSPLAAERLAEYEIQEEELAIHSVEDLVEVLANRVEEYESERLANVLKIARQINSGSVEDKKAKVTLSGSRDAIRYVFKEMEQGILATSHRNSSGSLNDDGAELEEIYQRYKTDRLSGKSRIYTHISGIDNHIALKRGDFIGILGFTGQRKSGLLRSMVYNAALDGSNVLHITLEQTYEEELIIYGIIHSHHPKWGQRFVIDRKNFDDGNLSEEEENFLFKEVIPDLKFLPGKLLIRQPIEGTTWDAVKTTAEITNQSTRIDLLAVDYLTLVSTKTGKKEEMEENIKDAKQFALHFDGGRGCIVVTPVQGNRDGFEAAGKNEGVWEVNGVYMYSEFDRTLDTLLTLYMGEDEKAAKEIIISSCKTRRSAGVPPFLAGVNSFAGYLTDLAKINMATDVRIDGLIESFF